MKKSTNRSKTSRNFDTIDHETKIKSLISDGKKFAETNGYSSEEQIIALVRELISVYDNPFHGHSLREKACEIVGTLAKQSDQALDLVIESARHYARVQKIDDADPYSPNSFDILAKLGMGNQKVISFLQNTVQSDWGIPRWEAIKALCVIDDPLAESIIIDVIKGKYPPKFLALDIDLRSIEKAKGRSFLENYRF